VPFTLSGLGGQKPSGVSLSVKTAGKWSAGSVWGGAAAGCSGAVAPRLLLKRRESGLCEPRRE